MAGRRNVNLTYYCEICGEPYHPYKLTSRTCCRPHANALTSRESAQKRSDKLKGRGEGRAYKKLLGRHEHRVIAEEKIGRKLEKGEIVHHIDGNKQNNDPSNLEIITQSVHVGKHRRKFTTCSEEGCDRPHVARGLCRKHYAKWYRANKTA
jgi:hypothetical protein